MKNKATSNLTKAIGECGKSLIVSLLRENGFLVTKADTEPTDYVDFLVYKNQQLTKMFVRTDTRMALTHNIVLERFMHRENKIQIGWFFEGKADILCYLDACEGNVFFFDWNALREYVTTHCKASPFRNPYDEGTIGDAYLVSIRELIRNGMYLDMTTIDVTPMYQFDFHRPAPF